MQPVRQMAVLRRRCEGLGRSLLNPGPLHRHCRESGNPRGFGQSPPPAWAGWIASPPLRGQALRGNDGLRRAGQGHGHPRRHVGWPMRAAALLGQLSQQHQQRAHARHRAGHHPASGQVSAQGAIGSRSTPSLGRRASSARPAPCAMRSSRVWSSSGRSAISGVTLNNLIKGLGSVFPC